MFTPRYGWNTAKVGVTHQSVKINQKLHAMLLNIVAIIMLCYTSFQSHLIFSDKMQNKTDTTVGTVPPSNTKITVRCEFDTLNTHNYICSVVLKSEQYICPAISLDLSTLCFVSNEWSNTIHLQQKTNCNETCLRRISLWPYFVFEIYGVVLSMIFYNDTLFEAQFMKGSA